MVELYLSSTGRCVLLKLVHNLFTYYKTDIYLHMLLYCTIFCFHNIDILLSVTILKTTK